MCTILTFTKDFYYKNKDDITARLLKDSISNSDGCALLTIGQDDEDTLLLKCLSVRPIITALESAMDSGAERAWLHLRFATTSFTGINGCHGFAADDYLVFHNGCMARRAADAYNVDSELIADDIKNHGIDEAISLIADHEYYVNAFIVNTTTGAFTVIRMDSGSLYTDNEGNYSTEAFGTIATPVEPRTRTDYTDAIIIPKPTYNYPTKYSSMLYDYDEILDTYVDPSTIKDGREQMYNNYYQNINLQINCLQYIHDRQSFEDMAEWEDWRSLGIADEVWDEMSVQQRRWAEELDLYLSDSITDFAEGQ